MTNKSSRTHITDDQCRLGAPRTSINACPVISDSLWRDSGVPRLILKVKKCEDRPSRLSPSPAGPALCHSSCESRRYLVVIERQTSVRAFYGCSLRLRVARRHRPIAGTPWPPPTSLRDDTESLFCPLNGAVRQTGSVGLGLDHVLRDWASRQQLSRKDHRRYQLAAIGLPRVEDVDFRSFSIAMEWILGKNSTSLLSHYVTLVRVAPRRLRCRLRPHCLNRQAGWGHEFAPPPNSIISLSSSKTVRSLPMPRLTPSPLRVVRAQGRTSLGRV